MKTDQSFKNIAQRMLAKTAALTASAAVAAALVTGAVAETPENKSALPTATAQTSSNDFSGALSGASSNLSSGSGSMFRGMDNLSSPNSGVPKKAGQGRIMSLNTPGGKRDFLVQLPRNYKADTKAPLIFEFGGKGHSIYGLDKIFAFPDANAIVVTPQGKNGTWEGAPYSAAKRGEDVEFVKLMLAKLTSLYKVDSNRIYASGFSNGGGFAGILACRMPDTFAAVAALSAAYYVDGAGGCATKTTNFLDAHSLNDDLIHYIGGNLHGSRYIAAPEYTHQVAKRARCNDVPAVEPAGLGIMRTKYSGCNHDVVHYQLIGDNHTINLHGPAIEDIIWKWLKSKRKTA